MISQKINNWKAAVLVLFWPFIYLFPYVFPIHGNILLIGNDFFSLYYKYKVYLLDLLNSLHFPLWSPSEASGYPFFSNPFAQTFYPFNILLALKYRLAGGYTILDHQRFTVFGISIFALGLLLWLRSLNIDLRSALISALVMPVSFKVIEIIRFPNAVHTACWYPWILYAITKIALSTSRKKALGYGAVLLFSGFCILTGGYPYYVYYSLFLFIPYSALILIPGLREKILNIKGASYNRAWIFIGIIGVLVALVTLPYLLQMSNLLVQTTDRAGKSYEYSTAISFNIEDTLGSLVYPPASQAEGWYHFGFVGLLLIVIYLFGKKDSDDQSSFMGTHGTIIRILLVIWLALISYITYGKESLLFTLLWKILPGFSSLRAWGRMNIILVPILAWLLALAYQYFAGIIAISPNHSEKARQGIWVLIGAYVGIISIQAYFIYNHITDYYWSLFLIYSQNFYSYFYQAHGFHIVPDAIQIQTIFNCLFVFFGLLSALTCLYFLWRARTSKPISANVLLILFLILSVSNTFIVAPWMWSTDGWSTTPEPSLLTISKKDKNSFKNPRIIGQTISLGSDFYTGILPNWYYDRYVSFLKRAESEPDAANALLGRVSAQKIYFSRSITPISIQGFLDEARNFQQVSQVKAYNGDYLELIVDVPVEGYISFIDNWDTNWKAGVDGQLVGVMQLFGTFKSIKVPAGTHKVVFAYCPPFFEKLNHFCNDIQ